MFVSRSPRRLVTKPTRLPGPKRWRSVLALGALVAAGLPHAGWAQFTQPVTIPLQLVNISGSTTNPSYKLGITIGFDSNVPKLYEFDTGATGFFAAYNTTDPTGNPSPGVVSWWNGGTPTGQAITMTYTSGNEYADAAIATTNLSFYPPGQTTAANPIATISGVNVARIGAALTVPKATSGNPTPTPVPNTAWYTALQAGQPPLQGNFYGDFGMGLYRNQGNPIDTGIAGLFAILPQFQFTGGSGVLPGFIVRTGGYPGVVSASPTPTVQVGITQADIDSFPYAIPMQSGMNGTSGTGITFPGSGAATFDAAAIDVDMGITLTGQSPQAATGLSMVLDTGAPSTMIHEGTGLTIDSALLSGSDLATGAVFTLSSSPWAFAQLQNGLRGQGKVGLDTSSSNPYSAATGYLNSGLTLFFNYNVMYDLSHGMLRLQPLQPVQVPIYRASGTQGFVIYAAMGVGGALVPYLLDTGSPQTFASYGSWWATPPPMQTTQGANLFKFAAGFGYYWTPWQTVVALGTNNGQILATTAAPVNIGLITNVDGSNLTPQQTYAQWQSAYAGGGTPFSDPVANSGTFGNFGAALYGDSTFATILAQMPLAPGLKHGFIIDSGGAASTTGSVTIGLSAAAIAQFQTTPGAIILPMAALESGGLPQYLAGGAPAYQTTQVTSSILSLNHGQYTAAVPTIFDTGGGQEVVFYQNQSPGAPDPVPSSLITGGGSHGPILPGTFFSLSGANASSVQQSFLSFFVQNTLPAQNTLDLDANLTIGIGGVRVNTGIQIFNQYQVMFDLDDGLLGLLPITTPTPSPTPLPAPPRVKILSRERFGPGNIQVRVRGTASSAAGIASVAYRIGDSAFRKARGAARWNFDTRLEPGTNVIHIRVTDSAGQTTRRTLRFHVKQGAE
jgi:hypothetical protein